MQRSNDDRVYGEEGNDVLWGAAGADQMAGGVGNDTLYGGDGNDQLDGGDGNDWLDGEAGTDQMVGGQGDDIYLVDNAGDAVFEQAGQGYDIVGSSVSYALNNIKKMAGAANASIWWVAA